MAHPHGLVRQHLPITNATLDTLGARVALNISTLLTNITTAFLMIRFRYMLQLTGRTAPDNGPICIIMANGNSTTGEVEDSLKESNTVGPKDITQMLTQDRKWAAYQSTLRAFVPMTLTEQFLDTGWQSFGGKGIPALADIGVAILAWNSGGGALTTGQSIDGSVWIEGVWLRD